MEKRMTATEAIRLGAMLHPQAYGHRHERDGSSCVLGAIEDAIGCIHDGLKYSHLLPILSHEVANPVTGTISSLDTCIAGLNNRGGDYLIGFKQLHLVAIVDREKAWTRERIADWLEPIEASFDAACCLSLEAAGHEIVTSPCDVLVGQSHD